MAPQGWLKTIRRRYISDQSIVIGLDGSENASTALRWATDKAHHTGGEILAVHAMKQFVPARWPADAQRDFRAAVHDEATKSLQEWVLPLRKAGVPYRTFVIEEQAAEALLQVAKNESAGMIVVGRRGMGGFARLLLGSVSHHLVQQSPVPVVVIPPPQKA